MDRSFATSAVRAPGALKAVVVVGMGAVLLGCPNPQTYGTPRTTPAGKIAHTVALEGIHASSTTTVPATPATPASPGTPATEKTSSLTLPMLPTYQLRAGLADRVDLGVRITNMSALGADVKWNFYKSPGFDLAVAPNVQMNYFSANGASIFILYGHLPILAGINFGESATLVLAGGLSVAYGSGTATGDEATRSVSGGNAGARGGIGLNVRVSKKFALHPEITGIKFFGDTSNLMVVFGLGFNFGQLPSYASGSEDDAPEDAQPTKDPNTAPANTTPAPTPGVTPVPAPTPAPAK
jgi:hypothetical protein